MIFFIRVEFGWEQDSFPFTMNRHAPSCMIVIGGFWVWVVLITFSANAKSG